MFQPPEQRHREPIKTLAETGRPLDAEQSVAVRDDDLIGERRLARMAGKGPVYSRVRAHMP